MALLRGRAGRLAAEIGGFRLGQWTEEASLKIDNGAVFFMDPDAGPTDRAVVIAQLTRRAGSWVTPGAPQTGGSRVFFKRPRASSEHLLTSCHTILVVEFGGHPPTFDPSLDP
jgi:hypothetical protein